MATVDRSEETRQKNIARFEALLGSVSKEGTDKLLRYIKKHTDFYTAPASTRFHSAYKGGLLQHTLNVYDCLAAKKMSPMWAPILEKVSDESIIVIGLLHDLCKTNFYVETLKNQKTYDAEKVAAADPRQVKHDATGDYIWETVTGYQIEDKLPLGHGEKSVILAQSYIRLTCDEVMAIRWHMGFSDMESPAEKASLSDAIRKYPICLAMAEADMEATYLMEKED
jgi:hypothetical protein